MRACTVVALVLASLVPEGPARAQTPNLGDDVLLCRVFRRDAGGTHPLARFGMIVSRRDEAARTVELGGPAAGELLDVRVVRRKSTRLSWRLSPSGAEGRREVTPGGLLHVPLTSSAGSETYASVEVGRAADFPHAKLARHFGWPGGGSEGAPAPRRPGAVAVAPSPPRVLQRQPRPSPSAAILLLTLRLDRDGIAVFEPRVRVRAGEAWSVRGGDRLEPSGGPAGRSYDGVEMSGRAVLDGADCTLDLTVQTGRLAGEGDPPATWLVDRYRSGVSVPLGSEIELELFEDLVGLDAGSTTLRVGCQVE